MANGIEYSLVEEALSVVGKNIVDFYKFLGITRQQNSNNKKIGYYPIKHANDIAQFFNVTVESVLNNTFVLLLKKEKINAVIVRKAESATKKQPISDDTVNVPFFKDGVVSAGFGAENGDLGDHDLLPFKPEDLRIMFNVSPKAKIGIIPCFGNSMEPTIHESDLIVFCHDGQEAIEGAIYVCRYDGELFVKRFKKRPCIALISDNKDYEPINVEEHLEIDIIGRVVGSYSINSKRF